ncbi:hypothetical protein [Aquitalea denitrificans]|uniref:hypothetical protein n=1 Tax=Aquitalea denitrificans TaxID=519081 RepID=UPI001359F9D3|nr:hypothetical protein [Aquitalea denitrificans]
MAKIMVFPSQGTMAMAGIVRLLALTGSGIPHLAIKVCPILITCLADWTIPPSCMMTSGHPMRKNHINHS